MFWFLIDKASEIAYFFGPWLLLAATALWALRLRSLPSYVGLVAGVFIASGHFAHMTTPRVNSISLAGLQPAVGENLVVYFFYRHGMSFGFLLLAIALIAQYLRRQRVA